ncbi:hypothetical protein C0993_004038 [Termitomyces sp. T159_Od127]|nr:hypothetical protein C0993_004038 [Termitomyces sp. T159_Od127]
MHKTRATARVVDANPIVERPSDHTISETHQLDASTPIVEGKHISSPLAFSRHEETIQAEPTAITHLSSSPSRPISRTISNPEQAPHLALKSTKSRLLTQLDEMSKQKPKPLSNPRQRKPEPQPEPGREPEHATEPEIEEKSKSRFRPASAARQIKEEPEPQPVRRPDPATARQGKPYPDFEPGREDEMEEDNAHLSGAIKKDALDAGRKDSVENEEDEDFWRFGTQSVGPSSSSSRKQESVPRPAISPTLNPRLTKIGSTNNVEVKKEPEDKKVRAARARLSTVHAIQLPRASARPLAHFDQNPDQRFMVTVHGPRPGQGADFRTRGGHKIKKVLESACRTFQLPFERSQLVLEDDSQDATQYYCDPEETLGACGIDTDARLLVQVDGMTDEELSKYGEEEDED